MVDWKKTTEITILKCLDKLKSGQDIKKDSNEIDEWPETIRSFAETLTILIKNVEASQGLPEVEKVAIDYLLYLREVIDGSDAKKIKDVADSIKEVGKALEVLIESNKKLL